MLTPDTVDFTALPQRKKGFWSMLSALTAKTGTNDFELVNFANKNNFQTPSKDILTEIIPKCIKESGAEYSVEAGVELEKATYLYFVSYPLNNNGQAMQQSRWFGLLSFEISKNYEYVFALQKRYKSYEFINRLKVADTTDLELEGGFSDKFLVKVGTTNPAQSLEFLTPDVMYVLYDTTLITSVEVVGNRVTIMCNVLGSDSESIRKFYNYCASVQNKIIN